MNKRWVLATLILCAYLLSSCTKDSSEVSTGNHTVYASGFIWNNGNFPCYWKGNNRVDLPGGIGAFTTSIFVYGGSVYTAGYYINGNGNQAPCYWKDTVRVDLPYGNINDAYTTSIFVSNGVVYTAGHYWDGTKGVPCYWVNTVRKEVPDAGAFVSSIYVVDTVVYLGGYRSVQMGYSIPCYWKSNVSTDLSTGSSQNGQVKSLFVTNGIVYACGSYGDMGINIPCYWTNSDKTDLEASATGFAASICVDGGTVYTAGFLTQSGPCYWKGTSRTNLNGSDVVSISVKQGVVFSAGRYYKPDGIDDFHVPCYWVGTSRVDLPVIENHDHNSTTAIFVE